MLHSITILINFIFLIAAVWLGIYVVTRSSRSLIACLTGLTLWSVAGLFLNMLLALNPPPLPADMPTWVLLLFPFWPGAMIDSGWSGWLQGWLVIPAIVFWHHVTVLMRPGPMNRSRWLRVILGYIAALAAIFIHLYTPLLFVEASGNPLFLTSLKPGILYPLFISLLLIFTILSIVNLLRSARSSPSLIQRKQFNLLALATLIAGLTGPVALIAAALSVPFPRVIISLLLGIPVMMLGYGVARYSALMEGRTIQRDFVYNAIAMGLVTGLYLLMTWISSQLFNVPAVIFIFLVLLAIITHSLIDTARQTLDFIFYREDKRSMRLNLRRLANFVGEQEVEDTLSLILDTMCASVRATYGLIISFEEYRLVQSVTYQWHKRALPVSQGDLVSDDVLHLEPGTFTPPLEDAALLIPLYSDTEQFGAIIFGRPINGIRYSNTDVDLLLYPSDRVADAILDSSREKSYLNMLSQIAQSQQAEFTTSSEIISADIVDDALRNLFDFSHLGDTSLVELKLVHQQLPGGALTHIDRGKAVHEVLTQAVDKLRPADQFPGEPVPREWYPYVILHGAYLEDRLNRDIMSQLYISEGTFNRTRRSAIRSVTRMLEEMEAALS
jgi:uncharacterized membrane protein